MELVSVAALSSNRVIGNDGELPWPSIPADKEQYRARISESPIILGRVTFESMLDDLPGTEQIVLSRTEKTFSVPTAHHAGTVAEAIEYGEHLGSETIYVIGGAKIYELFQPYVDQMVLSRVHGEYEGDSYYPEWDASDWEILTKTEYDRFTLEEWQRK